MANKSGYAVYVLQDSDVLVKFHTKVTEAKNAARRKRTKLPKIHEVLEAFISDAFNYVELLKHLENSSEKVPKKLLDSHVRKITGHE